jgi:hypothetical protein
VCGLYLGRPHGIRVADAVMADVAFNPVDVRLLGAVGEMFDTQRVANLVKQFHRRLLRNARPAGALCPRKRFACDALDACYNPDSFGRIIVRGLWWMDRMGIRAFKLAEWSFIPGPEWNPPDSSLNLQDLVEYPPASIAEVILTYPGMVLQNAGEPTWWDWLANWHDGEETIDIGMSLFETEPESWGGSPLRGHCPAERLLSLWKAIREKFPAVWLHNNECEIHTPESFSELFL